MRKFIAYIGFFFLSTLAFAQVPGTWNEYFSFRNVQQLECVDDNVFALSENGIFIYNTSSQEIQKITKLNGLSTVGLTCMAFCDSTSSFLIGYNDGSLDILDYPSLKVKAIPTIANKSLYGSKKINTIAMHNDTAVIATEFGVLTFSMSSQKFISTTILSNDGSYVPAKSVAVDDKTMYAATTKGIFSASVQNANLSDYSSWTKLTGIPYENDTISHIAALNGTIYYAHKNTNDTSKDSIFKIRDGKAEAFKTQVGHVFSLRNRNNTLIIATNYTSMCYSSSEYILCKIDTTNTEQSSFTDILQLHDKSVWASTKVNGILSFQDKKIIFPNCPYSNVIADIQYFNDNLYMVAGAISRWANASFSLKLQSGDWYGHNNWRCSNSISVCADPINKKYYYNSYGTGLVECSKSWWFDTIYTTKNSIIQNQFDTQWAGLYGIAADTKGNIWMINYRSKFPLLVKEIDGKWESFAINEDFYKKIYIDSRGYKWLTGSGNVGVFYENKTIDNNYDDLFVEIKLKDSEGSIAAFSNCVVEDLDKEIWIGTNQGIAVHTSPSRVFKDRQSISRIKIEIDGEVGYLLSSENITCIAVDGANRKWIGTENSGVFLISENGTEQLLNFTKSNSPLPTNSITSITIDHKKGEVYFGTPEGLVSYTSDATMGNEKMDNVKIFPNPVREDYNGDIYISGLVSDAILKITDISGNLVRTITANGGTATWDGRNIYGDRVQTGVYLIYISDETATYTTVKKILFIN